MGLNLFWQELQVHEGQLVLADIQSTLSSCIILAHPCLKTFEQSNFILDIRSERIERLSWISSSLYALAAAQLSIFASSSRVVDLGYSEYQGWHNETTNLDIYLRCLLL